MQVVLEVIRKVSLYLSDRKKIIHISQISDKLCNCILKDFFFFGLEQFSENYTFVLVRNTDI